MDLTAMIKSAYPEKIGTLVIENKKQVFITGQAHYMAYACYSKLFGKMQTAERLAERGGFGKSELDAFYPEWRNHIVTD